VLEYVVVDLRHALRALCKRPLFAVTAMLTLACGTAAAALVLGAIDAVLVRPLAVEAPEELYAIRRAGEPRARFSLEFQRALAASPAGLQDAAARFTFPVTVVQGATGAHASAAFVSANYFRLLGVPARLGRIFSDEGDAATVVISDRFWRERFDGRRSAVGQPLRIGNAALTVGGVAPASFQGLQLDVAVDLWVPISTLPTAVPITGFRPSVEIVGRVPASDALPVASSRLAAAFERWAAANPESAARAGRSQLTLVAAGHGLDSDVRERFNALVPLLLGIAACLWVTTVVNVSGMLTVRLLHRAREVGLRLALGATPWRLLSQWLGEVLPLVTGGLVLGSLAAAVLVRSLPAWIPSWAGVDLRVSPFVAIGTALIGALAAITMTAVEAFSVDRGRLLERLAPTAVRPGGRPSLGGSTWLIVAQFALTLPMIVAAGLLGESLIRLHGAGTGFDRSDVLQIRVEPVLVGRSTAQSTAYYSDVLERLRATPGVAGASVSSGGALSGFDGAAQVLHDGDQEQVALSAVDGDYFRTLGIRILAGRALDETDARRSDANVVLNATLARRLFGSEHAAIGGVVTFVNEPTTSARTVVGVVDDTADVDPRHRSAPRAYVPVGSSPLLIIHVRTAIEATSLIPTIRRTLISVDAGVPVLGIETIEHRHRQALQRERVTAMVAALGGWLALGLSAVGLFGNVSHDVSTRAREIGIRSALGASRARVAVLFLGRTAGIVLAALALGTAGALAGMRVLEGLVYGIGVTSVRTYVAAACLMALVAGIATLLPLGRAFRAPATKLLRE
jgi:predicted permease